MPLSALTLDLENARIHKPAQIRQIARSIEAFAFNVPILADREGKVLAGHGRLLERHQPAFRGTQSRRSVRPVSDQPVASRRVRW